MLTLKKLKEMEPHAVIAQGTVSDNSVGINMANSGRLLKWLALRGEIEDWCIYCYFDDEADWEYVQSNGDKVHSEDNIKKLVPCDQEAFGMYRY